jgi:hypothetical protein
VNSAARRYNSATSSPRNVRHHTNAPAIASTAAQSSGRTVNPLAICQDELAALVVVDWPGNAVREEPVADGARIHDNFSLRDFSTRARDDPFGNPRWP